MAILTTHARNKMASPMFGLPTQRKYPMPDANHARNALARVAEEYNKGKVSASQAAQVRAKAHRVLGK